MLDSRTIAFIAHYFKGYPSRSIVMVVLLILSGLAEGVGILALLPVLEIAGGMGEGEPSGVSRIAASALEYLAIPPTLGILLVLIVAAMTFKAVFRWIAMMQVGYTVAQISTDLRLRLIRALLAARWSYFTSHPVGHFATAISTESHRTAGAYRQACAVFAASVQAAIYFAVVLLVSWQVAVLSVLVGAVTVLLLGGFVSMSREAGQHQTDVMKSLVRRLAEALPGIKPVKAMAREEHLLPLLEREAEGFNRAQRRQVFASESVASFHEPILVLFMSFGLFAAVTWGGIDFSSLLVLVFLFYRLVGQVNGIMRSYQDVTVGESAFWSIITLIEEAEQTREQRLGTRSPPKLSEGIEFDEVSFAHGNTPVLEDVSFTIPAGSFVTFHGLSGAGKTTLVDLIAGLHVPTRGRILLDGVPLDSVSLDEWRSQIGYVPQETLLFNDSIIKNVTLGNDSIPRERVRWALEAAGAWEFVSERDLGLDTHIGELGGMLSGGQRQRICIARALVSRPTLLILDEATAALDPATELAICDTLLKLKGSITILAVSHQRALREVADAVYEVADRRVAAFPNQ